MLLALEDLTVEDELDHLERERAALQQTLEEAAPDVRPFVLLQVRALNRQIDDLYDQLGEAIADAPLPQSLKAARFEGTARLSTTFEHARGPFRVALEVGLLFDGSGTVTITDFPAIRTDRVDTPIGSNVTTITRSGGGTGDYGDGAIVLPITLRFSHSNRFLSSSELSLVLSTHESPGAPVDPGPIFGAVALAGSGTFRGGVLGGERADLALFGTITPVGLRPTTVPLVRELDPANAARLVEEAELKPTFIGDTGARGAWVWTQSPQAGTRVLRGSTVTMRLSTDPRL
jgi:hypothetical protein